MFPVRNGRRVGPHPPSPLKYVGFFNQGFFVDGALWVFDSTDGGATSVVRPTYTPSYTPHDSTMYGCPGAMFDVKTGRVWLGGSKGITTTDWTGSTVEIIYTTDLDHFTYSCSPDFSALTTGGSAKQTWFDGWFQDADGSVYCFILACPNATTVPLQCYEYIVPVNLQTVPPTFGTPVGPIGGTGFPTSILNPAMRKVGQNSDSPLYKMIIKNDDSGQKVLMEVTNTSIQAGNWTVAHTGNWAGWGSPQEAPYYLQMPDRLRVFLDPQGAGMQYSDCLYGNEEGSWTTPVNLNLNSNTFHAQHGHFIINPFGH